MYCSLVDDVTKCFADNVDLHAKDLSQGSESYIQAKRCFADKGHIFIEEVGSSAYVWWREDAGLCVVIFVPA